MHKNNNIMTRQITRGKNNQFVPQYMETNAGIMPVYADGGALTSKDTAWRKQFGLTESEKKEYARLLKADADRDMAEFKRTGTPMKTTSSNAKEYYQRVIKSPLSQPVPQAKVNPTTRKSFNSAFAEARKSGLKTFDWNGKSYTTQLAEDKPKQQAPREEISMERIGRFIPTSVGQEPIQQELMGNTQQYACGGRIKMADGTPLWQQNYLDQQQGQTFGQFAPQQTGQTGFAQSSSVAQGATGATGGGGMGGMGGGGMSGGMSAGVGAAGQIGSGIAQSLEPKDKPGYGANIAGGAMAGAAAGASLGPIGVAGGALIGGALGWLKGKKKAKTLDEQDEATEEGQEALRTQNLMRSRGFAQPMADGGYVPTYQYLPKLADGGGIEIDPAKRGTFKAQATRMDMGVQEAAHKILNAPKGRYTPAMRRKAVFAQNFAKAYGGFVNQYANGGNLEPVYDTPQMPGTPAYKGGADTSYFATGGIHEQSKFGGVPLGRNALVEQGEFRANLPQRGQYIYSNRLPR